MKKILCIVGAGLAVGAVTVAFYLLNNKKNKVSEVFCEGKSLDDKFEADISEPSKTVTVAQDEPVYEDVKSSAIGNMYSRHEGAAIIMSDSVNEIRKNIKVSENTNAEIDEISDELDRMIRED